MINLNSKFVKNFKAICEHKHINYSIGYIHITQTRLTLLGLLSEDIIILCSYKSWLMTPIKNALCF